MSVKQSKCAQTAREIATDPAALRSAQVCAQSNCALWEKAGYSVALDAWEAYVLFVYAHPCLDSAVGESHHVFPKSVFPKLKSTPWNVVPLTPENHFHAHALLFDAVPACPQVAGSFMMMGGQPGGKTQRNSQASVYAQSKQAMAGKLQVRDGDRVIYVDRGDPRVLSGELKHFNHGRVPTRLGDRGEVVPLSAGKVVLKDTQGNHLQVDVGDPRVGSAGYKTINTGTVSVSDAEGNCFRISTDDPRWLNGSVSHRNKGTVCVMDPATGERFRVAQDDPRWLEGALVSIIKGTVPVVDPATGERFRCSRNDPRYLAGELIHQNKGKTFVHPEGFIHPNKGKIVAYTSAGERRVVSRDHPDIASGLLTVRPSKRRPYVR